MTTPITRARGTKISIKVLPRNPPKLRIKIKHMDDTFGTPQEVKTAHLMKMKRNGYPMDLEQLNSN